jgi:tRNA1(Val) A37 N6-methylase TrmN6
VITLDVTASAEMFAAQGLSPDSVDIVLMNPPFNDAFRHRASPDGARQAAHVAQPGMLESWVHAARRILKSGGAITLIWRADGIAEVLVALSRGFGSLAILPVHGEAGKPAIRVLIRAVKGGKAPARLHASLVLNKEPGVPNKEVAEILAGNRLLRLTVP